MLCSVEILLVRSRYGGGSSDAFVAKVHASGSALVYSSYLGGSGDDRGRGIAVGGDGSAYLMGDTNQQYLDFLRNTQFRQSLLCRQDVRLDAARRPEVLRTFQVASPVKPVSPRQDSPRRGRKGAASWSSSCRG